MSMYKVLIVDDEVLLRVGLKMSINWEEAGFTVVAEAANGEQGFDQYKKHRPDVVITDIRMPKQDGLWLVEKIRKENASIPILVLTCHDEFSYARNALKVGADDYILKSEVEDEDLLGIMNKLKKKLDKQNQDRNLSQDASTSKNDMRRALFNDLIKTEFEVEEGMRERFDLIALPLENTCFAFASVTVFRNPEEDRGSFRQIDQAVINLLFNLLEDREIAFLYTVNLNRYHFLLSSPALSVSEIRRIFLAANQGAMQYFDKVLQIVYTDAAASDTPLYAHYQEFLNKADIGFYQDEPVFYMQDAKNITFEELNSFELKKKYRQLLLIDYIMKENTQSAGEFARELYKYFKNKMAHPSSVKLFFSDIVGHLFRHYHQIFKENDMNHEYYHYKLINAYTLREACEILKAFFMRIIEVMRQYVQNNAKLLANQAVSFIEQKFDKKISLKDVAENLNLSKHYLCSIFKKETGDNVSHYINTLRIEKAKILLHKKDKKIKEIFEEVGYSNQQYFSKVFKKTTGMTVLEYKEKINP